MRLGVTPRMIDRRLASREWVRLAPNVYAVAAFPPTWQRQYMAAQLSVPGGALCQYAAPKVLGWDGFKVAPPEVVVAHRCRHVSPLATVHRGTDVRTTTAGPFLVTTPAQTLCDLLTRMRLDRWEATTDALLLTNRLKLDDLIERRESYEASRRPGIGLLRSLVDERAVDGWCPPESELERMLHEAVDLVADCPPVEWQAPAPWNPDERVDALIRSSRLVLEADGRRWHARVRDFDRDKWRDNQAAALGYRVQRFTHHHLRYRLDEVVQIIRDAVSFSSAA